jgi:nucleoside-diphosphate-sugar epimerase
MRKVLVSGATGFIGIEVSKQLAMAGRNPRLMVRRPLRGVMLKRLEAEIVQADLRSPRSLKRVLQGVDTVIHLGARAAFIDYGRLYPSIVGGSINFMRAAIEAGVRRFVFGGSLLVYPGRPQPIDQQTEARPLSGYGRAKRQAESEMARLARQAGIQFTSLRLPHVYGAHSLLFDQVRQGRIIFPGRGTNHFAHLHVGDAARALIQAARSDLDGVYVVADDQSCSWNAFFETIQTYYPRLRVVHLPRLVALAGARLLDGLFKLVGRPNPWPSGAVNSWNLNLPVVPRTVSDVLGVEIAYPTIYDGIPAVLDDAISFYWLPSNLDRS